MTAPYDYDALWGKAKLFLNHAMDEEEARTFDEQALWAALALEVLAKAALAKVSPLLIAVPTEEGKNLLVASGLLSGDAFFKSVSAKTLMSRCARAFKPFSGKEAERIVFARNAYLHGSSATFTSIPPDAWWPTYWAQAAVLVTALDRTLPDLVGHDRASIVEGHLARNHENIKTRVESLIDRARQRVEQHLVGELPARVVAEWNRLGDLSAGLVYRDEQDCPACDDVGFLEGDDIVHAEPHYEQIAEDDFDAWVDVEINTEYFSCENCHLVLDRYEYVVEAGLPESFSEVEAMDAFYEPEYGND